MKTIEIIQNLIVAIMIVTVSVTGLDFAAFVIKRAPKSSNFSKYMWKIGFVCAVWLVYWLLNGQQFYQF